MNVALYDPLALIADLAAVGDRFGDLAPIRCLIAAIAAGRATGVGHMLLVVGVLYRLREQPEIGEASRRAIDAIIRTCLRKRPAR